MISCIAVRISQPNIDSIFFFPTISLLVIIYLFTEYTQRTVNTRSKLKTTQAHTPHAQRHRQRHPSINHNSSEIIPHRRTSYNSKCKRPFDTSRRIIFFIAVGLVVNMGVALRLEKPIEKGPVKTRLDCGAHGTRAVAERINKMKSLAVSQSNKRKVQGIFCRKNKHFNSCSAF